MNDIITRLNRQQANALVLYLNYKKYHWLSYGPLFRDFHLLFEEQGQEILGTMDELAERSLILGGAPVTDGVAYFQTASIQPSKDKLNLKEMVAEALANQDRVIAELHEDANLCAQQNDIGTADLFTRLVQIHQKQRWFLQSILRQGDSLVS